MEAARLTSIISSKQALEAIWRPEEQEDRLSRSLRRANEIVIDVAGEEALASLAQKVVFFKTFPLSSGHPQAPPGPSLQGTSPMPIFISRRSRLLVSQLSSMVALVNCNPIACRETNFQTSLHSYTPFLKPILFSYTSYTRF